MTLEVNAKALNDVIKTVTSIIKKSEIFNFLSLTQN